MRPDKPIPPVAYHEHDTAHPDPEELHTASAQECTGLMYRVPLDDPELEAYQELYDLGIPKGGQEVARKSVQANLHRARTPREAGEAVERAGGAHAPEDPNSPLLT